MYAASSHQVGETAPNEPQIQEKEKFLFERILKSNDRLLREGHWKTRMISVVKSYAKNQTLRCVYFIHIHKFCLHHFRTILVFLYNSNFQTQTSKEHKNYKQSNYYEIRALKGNTEIIFIIHIIIFQFHAFLRTQPQKLISKSLNST